MTADATDAEVKNSKLEQVLPPSVDNNDPLEGSITDTSRTNQQQLLPAAVQARILGQIIGSSPEGTSPGTGVSVTATVSNSTSTVFTFITRDNQERILIGVPDISVYIGDVSSDNQWPTVNFGGGNMPVYQMNDWGQTDNINVVTRVVVRNNTGSDQPVTVISRVRLITNPATASKTPNS